MKILLVSSGSGSRGGGEIFLDYLGDGLAARGHEIITWIPAHPRMDELAEKVSRFGVVIRADYRNMYDYKIRTLATAVNRQVSDTIAKQWQSLAPDVIHLNKQNLEDGLDLLRSVSKSGVPSVCTIHLTQTAHYLRARLPWLRDWIARQALRSYRGIFVAVQEVRRKALENFLGDRQRTQTIFNGVPLANENEKLAARGPKRRELGVAPENFLVLGVGRLVSQKQPLVFLKTAKEIYQRFPAARFLWVGDGGMAAHWDEWVARENLGEVISRIGWQKNVNPFLFAADLLLHVAEFEGLPFAVVEAMAAGLPCAVRRTFAAEIPLFNEDNVLFVEEEDSLAERLKDPALVSRIGARGRRLVEQELSVSQMVNAYEQLYAEAMRG